MITGIIFIIVIASALYFFDDIPKWIESAKKFWNDPSILFDRNIKTRVKPNVTKEDVLKIQKQQMQEAKKGFQEILNGTTSYRKPHGYGQDLKEKLSKFEEQIKSKSKRARSQRITDWERKYLWDGISKRKRVPCINCELEDMYKGRTEGPYQYWHCPSCGQGVKLSFYANTLSGFQCENIGIDKNKKHFM